MVQNDALQIAKTKNKNKTNLLVCKSPISEYSQFDWHTQLITKSSSVQLKTKCDDRHLKEVGSESPALC